jgi:hypothetical protein
MLVFVQAKIQGINNTGTTHFFCIQFEENEAVVGAKNVELKFIFQTLFRRCQGDYRDVNLIIVVGMKNNTVIRLGEPLMQKRYQPKRSNHKKKATMRSKLGSATSFIQRIVFVV